MSGQCANEPSNMLQQPTYNNFSHKIVAKTHRHQPCNSNDEANSFELSIFSSKKLVLSLALGVFSVKMARYCVTISKRCKREESAKRDRKLYPLSTKRAAKYLKMRSIDRWYLEKWTTIPSEAKHREIPKKIFAIQYHCKYPENNKKISKFF